MKLTGTEAKTMSTGKRWTTARVRKIVEAALRKRDLEAKVGEIVWLGQWSKPASIGKGESWADKEFRIATFQLFTSDGGFETRRTIHVKRDGTWWI